MTALNRFTIAFPSIQPPSRLQMKRLIIGVPLCVLSLIGVRGICSFVIRYISRRHSRLRKLEEIKRRKTQLLQLISEEDLPHISPEISYDELKCRLQNNELRAVDVLRCFQKRALEVDERLNCVTDVVLDAVNLASCLDGLPVDKRKRLHGIPLSVKESINMSTFDSTLGCSSRCFQPEIETNTVITALLHQGMIPFVRTNLSICTRMISSSNPLFGEALNPHNLARTTGGSSGGEAALISAGGSLVGIGSDVGGSIRVPASYCGIFGFKPTAERCSLRGSPTLKTSMINLFFRDVYGPMSKDMELIVEVMRIFFSDSLYALDFSIPRLLFDSSSYEDNCRLKIGFYCSLDSPLCVEPVTAVRRVMMEVRTALEEQGHSVVDWQPPEIDHVCKLIVELTHWDCGIGFRKFLLNETLVGSEMFYFSSLVSLPRLPVKVLIPFIGISNPLLATYLDHATKRHQITDIVDLEDAVTRYRRQCEESWLEAGIDVLVCPVSPTVAPPIKQTENIVFSPLYCKIYNLLDYPAGVVPFGSVTHQDVDLLKETYGKGNTAARTVYESQINSIGMPVGVQCVAMKFHDELALRLMNEIHSHC